LAPAVDGGDDLVGIGGPDEGLGVMIGLVEVAVDGGLEVDDGAEDAALEASLGQGGEEGLDGVEPGARGQRFTFFAVLFTAAAGSIGSSRNAS
jgi:hypothetical protein